MYTHTHTHKHTHTHTHKIFRYAFNYCNNSIFLIYTNK